MADLSCSCTNRKSSSFATKHFQRKSLKSFRPSSAAEKVSIVCGTNNHVKSEMLSNRHTDTQTKYRNPRCACVPRYLQRGGARVCDSRTYKALYISKLFRSYGHHIKPLGDVG